MRQFSKQAGFVNLINAIAILMVSFLGMRPAFADDSTRYITESAVLVAIATPEKAMLEPALEMLPREIFSVLSEDELGFDVTKMKKFLAVVEKPISMENPPGFGIVMEFGEAQSVSDNLTRGMQKGTLQGKVYYRPQGEGQPGILVVDEKTIMIGLQPTLESMLRSSGAKSKLIELVARKNTGDHIQIFADIEALRPFVKENFGAQLRQIPPAFAGLAELPFQIDSARLTMNLGDKSNVALALAANDQDSAIAATDSIVEAIELGRQMIVAQLMSEMGEENPRLRDAAEQYFARVGNKIVAILKPERVGSNISWKFEDSGSGMVTYAGIAVAFMMPAVQSVRSAAERTTSSNNLRQLAIAMHNYESAHRTLPARANFDANGRPLLSWRVHLLPYLEERELYDQFKLDEPWDSPHNKELIDKMPSIYQLPNADLPNGKTVYLGVEGSGAFFENEKARRFADFKDGTSNTVMLVEADRNQAVTWTKPEDWQYSQTRPFSGLSELFQVALCDGSVRSLSNSLSEETWSALITISGGEAVEID
jgi:hypothetical protein